MITSISEEVDEGNEGNRGTRQQAVLLGTASVNYRILPNSHAEETRKSYTEF